MDLSTGWTDAELVLIPERIIELLGNNLDEGKLTSSYTLYEMISPSQISCYRCSVCGRLHLQVVWPGLDGH